MECARHPCVAKEQPTHAWRRKSLSKSVGQEPSQSFPQAPGLITTSRRLLIRFRAPVLLEAAPSFHGWLALIRRMEWCSPFHDKSMIGKQIGPWPWHSCPKEALQSLTHAITCCLTGGSLGVTKNNTANRPLNDSAKTTPCEQVIHG